MGKQQNHVQSSLLLFLFIALLLALPHCELAPKTMTQCDLTVQLILVNNGADTMNVALVDSTQWLRVPLIDAYESFLPENSIIVPDSNAVTDTVRFLWSLAHTDIFEAGEACSAKVDIHAYAVFSRNDSVISSENLDLCCSNTEIDTTYTDENGVTIAKFYRSKTIFLPDYH